MSRELAKYWIIADEYERMGEAGIFPPDARLSYQRTEVFERGAEARSHTVEGLAVSVGEFLG